MERDSPKGNKVLCDDTNCEQSMSSSTTLNKIKEKLYSLHRKYSKLKQRNLDKRKEEISKLKNQQFVFSNRPKFNADTKKENACENKECFNTLPEKKNSKKTIKIRKNDSLLSTGLKRICCIFQQSDTGKSKKMKFGEKATNPTRRHENDQTGEPVLEIKVNTVGMCVMNPEDVKNKILLSKTIYRCLI
ncbi:uncharacterized protein LOC114239393 [Bombyx mandarina]|uniref:Uncharacterized protein LOC114239393 n=1 Tax=Bombyx mandarina TaxID=7092 RepID=A0A6J2J7N3_BOMMA|nr:uncharacterized protein LOC114239393 [Bombyx mandarina]